MTTKSMEQADDDAKKWIPSYNEKGVRVTDTKIKTKMVTQKKTDMSEEEVKAIVVETMKQWREKEEAESKPSHRAQENKTQEVKAEDEGLLKSETLIDASLAAIGALGLDKPKGDTEVEERKPYFTDEEIQNLQKYGDDLTRKQFDAAEKAGTLTEKDKAYIAAWREKKRTEAIEEDLDKLLNITKK